MVFYIANYDYQQKRLKLKNQVVAEMAEAIRFSLLSPTITYSDSIVSTIEENSKAIVKYAYTVHIMRMK